MAEVTGLDQQAAWRDRVLPKVEQVRTDLWSIPVPMPANPLRYVLVYALASDSGITLIDAGWDSNESWDFLCNGLASFGASITDVRGTLVTHLHLDHIGLAQRVREASGAWVALHPADYDAMMQPDYRDPHLADAADLEFLLLLGAPLDEAIALNSTRPDPDPRSTYAIPDRLIVDGENVAVPGWSLLAVHTPGHTPGHLCFFDEETKLLFAGDHVLPRISPNISAVRDVKVNALDSYLRSLDKICDFDADEVLPAHEWRFRGLEDRAHQLQDHHAKRLAELYNVCLRHPGSVAWELAAELTWSRPWDQNLGFVRISAVRETLAHIIELQRRQLIFATTEQVPRYRAVP
jgi:glyoxylase-like metal-dependent hydrolase (beta-lactamase superfamily II)